MVLGENELLDYGCTKFQAERYDEALEAFVLAYQKGYEREWVIENIYNCYMAGNEEEFRRTYGRQEERTGVAYEDCLLDFVPYQEGKYYIFDKEFKQFRGLFSVAELAETAPDASFRNAEFSAVLLEMDWNWREELAILAEAKERNVYIVSHDMRRCASFAKIPELAEYLKNIKMFADHCQLQNYFHCNTAVYLPKLICGAKADKEELIRIMDEEHQYRLTPEGRNTENVLLTIAIPTMSRGHLLLERMKNLQEMPYDAEIEFAISKHSMRYHEEEYDKVREMMTRDARIHYHDHGRDLLLVENWHYAVEMSHGTYVLLVSDEDDVVWGALEHYLKLLSDHPGVSLVRTKTSIHYCNVSKRICARKGTEAFCTEFLYQNYMSGMIVQREGFLALNLLDLERYSENKFYHQYPHECWCAMLTRKGDYIEEPVLLIIENESVLEEDIKRYKEDGSYEEGTGLLDGSVLPVYATYEARLEQFQAQTEFIKWFMGDNKEGIKRGFEVAFEKTSYLLDTARFYDYKVEEYKGFVDQFLRICMNAIDEAPLDEVQKAELLQCAQKWRITLLRLYETSGAPAQP